MGDMVILMSLVGALARRFGSPVDVVASGSWARSLLDGQPVVGDVHVLGSRRTPSLFSAAKRRTMTSLAAQGPRPVWYCDPDPWGARLLQRAGIPADHILLGRRDCPIRQDEHHVDRWLRFARMTPPGCAALAPTGGAADPVAEPAAPPLLVLPGWRDELDHWLASKRIPNRRLVLIQAGNKRTMRWWAPRTRKTNDKYWPESRWADVIRRILAQDGDCEVMLLGVTAEAAMNDVIAAAVRSPRVHNVAGELPIPRLLALQSRAVGMISVDTGPAHSGAAVGCPLVVLFGTARQERYAPRSPTGQVVCLQAHDAPPLDRMAALTVEDIEGAWRRLIDRDPSESLVASGRQ
jgi:hypothetical protein